MYMYMYVHMIPDVRSVLNLHSMSTHTRTQYTKHTYTDAQIHKHTNTQTQYSLTDPVPPCQYALDLQSHLRLAYQKVRETVATSHQQQKELYNRRVHGKPYAVGDLVWLHNLMSLRVNPRNCTLPGVGHFGQHANCLTSPTESRVYTSSPGSSRTL